MPDPQTHPPPEMVPGPPLPRGGDDKQPAVPHHGSERPDRGAWTIAPQGVIDMEGVSRLQRQVSDALTGYDRVVIDLHDVSVLGTPALALLCCALRRTHRPGATLVIAGATRPAHDALAVCELPGVQLAGADRT